jgi:type II secretory ATPase GspE/PulE/Tfp pilus assembly ATPase PilB-like protein
MNKSSLSWLLKLVQKELSSSDYEKFEATLPEEVILVWEHACSALDISMSELVKNISTIFSIDLAVLPISRLDISDIHESILEKYNVIALKEDDRSILFATANPLDQEVSSTLAFLTDKHVEFAISAPTEIATWLSNHSTGNYESTVNYSASQGVDNSATVRLVRKVLEQAISDRASDVHVEPLKGEGIVRFRIDGLLYKITTLPLPVFKQVGQRIKAVSNMDVTNNIVPQDGHVHLDTDQGGLDLRVSSMPVKGGEKFVIRLLQNNATKSLDEQNFLASELEKLKDLMNRQSGILVISGPTGSGKTTTLNSAIQEVNSVDKCIITIEDPIEYEIEGVAQINVNPAQGLTFDTALSHILRQDPDVILVGEIRNNETANTAIRSALTGHLVLTTLHTNDAITVIPRLKDLGVSDALLADSLKGLAAQRLVRKLCPRCATKTETPLSKLEHDFVEVNENLPAMRSQGCNACNNSGFIGRIPLLEILIVDEVLADAIRSGATTKQLTSLAKQQGMRTLADVATEHILNGSTTVEEVFRVLGNDLWVEKQVTYVTP